MPGHPPFTSHPFSHSAGNRTEWHTHEAGQVCRIEHGLLIIETERGRWAVPRGRLGWIPPGTRHAAFSQSETRGHSLYLTPAMCRRLPADPTTFVANTLADVVFDRLCTNTEGPLSKAQLRVFDVLLDELSSARQEPLKLPMPKDPRLRKLASRILMDPSDSRTAETLTQEIGISVRSFSRKFLAETGMQFVYWRQLARLIQALDWLDAGKPVGWVALSCGYNSTSSFIAVFRQYMGNTPGKWSLDGAQRIQAS